MLLLSFILFILLDSVLYPNTLKNSKKNSQKSRFKKSNNQFSTSSTRISTSTSSLNDDTSSNQIGLFYISFFLFENFLFKIKSNYDLKIFYYRNWLGFFYWSTRWTFCTILCFCLSRCKIFIFCLFVTLIISISKYCFFVVGLL